MPVSISKPFALSLQSREEWLNQQTSLTSEVSAEAKKALDQGLLTASVQLISGELLQIDCDRVEPSPEGDLHLFNAKGLLLAAVARNQWVSFELNCPDNLHCRTT